MKLLRIIIPYRSIPILMYHRIAITTPEEDPLRLGFPPDQFEVQMKYLNDRGFTTLTLDELILLLDNGEKIPDKRIVITFDDGYLDNYKNAFPILEKYGFSATIFVVTDFLGKMINWGIGKPIRLMDWSHIREMSRYSIFFQSHTCTHPDLTALTYKEAKCELFNSKKKIEDAIGLPVQHIAYPFGKYNQITIRICKKVCYLSAYVAGISDMHRFCLERFGVVQNDKNFRFILKISPWGSWLRTIWNLRF